MGGETGVGVMVRRAAAYCCGMMVSACAGAPAVPGKLRFGRGLYTGAIGARAISNCYQAQRIMLYVGHHIGVCRDLCRAVVMRRPRLVS